VIVECDEDVTATEATKADGGALGMRLVTIGELDAHREESPELIGSELELPIGREWHADVQDSKGLNLSLEERVRRKLILAGILPKLSDLGQGAIGEAIEAAGAGQFGRLHKEALNCIGAFRYNICTEYAREQTWRSRSKRSENDRAPTAGLSSDCDDLACGVASGGEARS
jgi:hypothetical protein